MADHINGFDDASTRRIVRMVHEHEAKYKNLDRALNSHIRNTDARPGLKPIFFRNDSGETIPRGAVVADDGLVPYGEGIPQGLVSGIKPDTTFRRKWFICPRELGPGESTKIVRGDYQEIKHESGWSGITSGQSGGPKPGSWELWQGYPSIAEVTGEYDFDKELLFASVHEITTLLCKATGDLTAGIIDSDYIICKGSMDDDEDAGYTELPDIELSEDIPEDSFFLAHWANGGWRVTTGGTSVARRFLATLDATLASGDATKGVTLTAALDGRPLPDDVTVTGQNPLGWAGPSGATCIVGENRSEDPKEFVIEIVQHYDCDD